MNKKIVIASDHAGYELKENIIKYMLDKEFIVKNLGTDNNESVDYPDYANKLGDFMLNNNEYIGILICGTGIGMSIAANRLKHIRAALCCNEEMAKMSREHNNANILVLGARILSTESAFKIIQSFLSTEFSKGRHKLRLKKLI